MYQILLESSQFCRRYYKNILVSFSGHTVYYYFYYAATTAQLRRKKDL